MLFWGLHQFANPHLMSLNGGTPPLLILKCFIMNTSLKAWKAPETEQVVITLASQNPEIRKMLSGKTLLQVAEQNGLTDADVDYVNTGNNIVNLSLRMNGREILIPLSRKFPETERYNPAYLLNCEFRETFLSVKDENGMPTTDEHGNVVLDESKPYLSFGKPNGITITGRESIFTEANKPAVDATAGKS